MKTIRSDRRSALCIISLHLARLQTVQRSPPNNSRLSNTPLSDLITTLSETRIMLPALCQKITTFRALDEAYITASECYVVRTPVRHRYIILELHGNLQNFWIRLDRRRASGAGVRSLLAFFFAASTSPSCDTVRNPPHDLRI